MERCYPAKPMVGVGATIFKGEQVLLVQRGREPAYGKWSLPGGLVELGEALQDAVQREVYEEVGLRVKVSDLVAVLDRVIHDEHGRIEYHYILLDFLCEYEGGEPYPASDVLDCAFVSLKNLSRYSLTHGTEEVIQRAFERSQGRCSPVYDANL